MFIHCHSRCHSTVAPAVAWIVHSRCLRRQNQGNSFYSWLSGACVCLIIVVFNIVENSEGGNIITLYSSIEWSYMSPCLHHTLPMLLMLLHCHSRCHSTVAPAVTWIDHSRRLKRQNQGNFFHWWLSGVCVFLLIVVFDNVENSQVGSLITSYSSLEWL